MGEELHIFQPPMEQRSVSTPKEWQCPDCASWWESNWLVPPQVAPAQGFMTHQGIVPAKWVLRENG